ncbi:MAG: isoaspartyl peptidase/L-asparaginase, partial [Gemmataceae bacterium]
MASPVCIATWPFGRRAATTASRLLQAGKPALDAALAGAQAVEDDPSVDSVGLGGLPDRDGVVSLDACVMDGKTLSFGAVAALERIGNPAAVARLVMEKTPHVCLAGRGALEFALANGFKTANLLTPKSLEQWQKTK